MMRYLLFCIITCFLLVSCKAKYEELQMKYNKTLERKTAATKELKETKKNIAVMSDSLKTLMSNYYFWKKYYDESNEILMLKTDFYKNIQSNSMNKSK